MKKQLLFSLIFVFTLSVFGQKLPFQGKLIEAGVPVEGTRILEFSIASQSWSETHADVPITDGLYFVVLGSINPLPDSLFYGTDEQSLDISVDGTALSPVILFKPLATPYEGSELNVKNLEGTVVGTLKARTDTVKHGEFKLHGENTGEIKASFYKANGDADTDMPFLSLQRDSAVLSYLSSSKWNDDLSGRIYLGSTNGDYANIYPNYFYGNHNGRSLFSIGHSNWSGAENFGLLLLDGPNSRNFELTGQHWGNPDLPFFKMKGTEDQTTLILSAENNPDESGTISLNTKRDENLIYRELSMNSTGLRIWERQNWDVLHEAVSLYAENQNDLGWSGAFNLSGPNSSNISIGSRYWEGTSDLPLINMFGENNFHGIELSITRDGENNQFGWINLMSENGKNLYLSPNNLGVQGVAMSTTTNNSGTFGSLSLQGPNSDNFQFMPSWWDKPDLPRMLLLGTSQIAAVDMGADLDGQQNEVGFISISSTDGSSAFWRPGILALNNTSGGQSIALETINNGLGEFGELRLNGSNGNPNVRFTGGGNEGNFGEFQLYNENGNSTLSFTPFGGAGLLTVFGESGGGIKSGFKFWEPNGGSNRPFQALEGTVRPGYGLIFSHIVGDNIVEQGQIELHSTDGSRTDINAYGITFNDNIQVTTYNANGISGSGTLSISNGVNITGDVVVNGVTEHSSDRRFKKNILSIAPNTLEKIQLIEGVSYDWRQDEFPERNFSSDKQIGLIAQELEAQFPDLVKTNKDGYKSVNYNGFTAVLLEAVKELNTKVEKLETENIQLKAELTASAKNADEIDALKNQMEALTQMMRQNSPSETAFSEETVSIPGLK